MSLSLTTTGTTGQSTYTTSTGVLNIPNYFDISYIALSVAGTTGASTFNTSTGALHIPNYADVSKLILANSSTTGAATFNSGTGTLNIPNYADLSKLLVTTTGRAGAATFIPGTGTLNIPVYLAGAAVNQALLTVAGTFSTTSTTPTSMGAPRSIAFTAVYNPSVLINYFCFGSVTTASTAAVIYIYRTTGTVPPFLTPVGGSDIQVSALAFYQIQASVQFSNTGIIYDTTLTVGTPYTYYFALSTASGTYNVSAGAILQLTETK